jgi:hypothetical protein
MAAGTWMNHQLAAADRERMVAGFMSYKGALVAPALQWTQWQATQMQPSHAALHGSWLLLMGGSEVQILSLELPMAAQSVPVSGTFVGFEGHRAVFVNGDALTVLNLRRGTVEKTVMEGLTNEESSDKRVPAALVGGQVVAGARNESVADLEAVLSGGRLYVTSETGVFCYNIYTGQKLLGASWPKRLPGSVESAEDKRGGASASNIVYYWKGVAGSAKGRTGYCLAPRHRVVGDTLVALVDAGRIAALRPVSRGEDVSEEALPAGQARIEDEKELSLPE